MIDFNFHSAWVRALSERLKCRTICTCQERAIHRDICQRAVRYRHPPSDESEDANHTHGRDVLLRFSHRIPCRPRVLCTLKITAAFVAEPFGWSTPGCLKVLTKAGFNQPIKYPQL